MGSLGLSVSATRSLQGERVREELQDLLSELPAIFQQTVDRLQALSPALSYYQSVMETNTGKYGHCSVCVCVLLPQNTSVDQWSQQPSCLCCTISWRMGM